METAKIPLNDGHAMPPIGFGVYLIWDYDQCKRAVLDALETGFRHIDTAQLYKNERAVGDAIRESGIPRDQIFVTSKIWCTNFGYEKATAAMDKSLSRMKLDYLDLMLLHQRFEDYKGAWRALEDAQAAGKARSIGVSNFDESRLADLLGSARIIPAVNQVECHPYFQRETLRAHLQNLGIAMQAWYPLGHGDKALLDEPTITAIAAKHGKTPAQVILRWLVQREVTPLVKSLSPEHIRENIDALSFELDEGDMAQIAALDKGKSYFNQPEWLERIMYKLSDKLPFGDRD